MSDKSRKPEEPSEVVAAAIAFERELRHFEGLARAACRDPLDSRKAIERAAVATRDAAGYQERTVLPLQELAAAMGRARDRFEASSQALGARAQEIQARMADLTTLFGRFDAIQGRASAINDRVVKLTSGGPPQGPLQTQTLAVELDDIGAEMEDLVEETRAIGRDAVEVQLPDLAKDAEALRQKVLAARQTIKRLRTSIAPVS